MVNSSASGDACARVYNLNQHADYEFPELTSEVVWNAFYLHALLAYFDRMSSTLPPESRHLELPHRGNNRNRRRGFHNTYVFYELLKRVLVDEQFYINQAHKFFEEVNAVALLQA